MIVTALDLAGIFVFSFSGASLAIRKDLDVVGAVALGLVTALAGGVLRDVTLGVFPIAAFKNPAYLLVAVSATAVVVLFPAAPKTLRHPVVLLDSAGLALFCVVGALKATEADLSVGPIIILGALSATGGGILRDVLVREVPEVFAPHSHLYMIPAALGSGAVGLFHHLGMVSGLTLIGIAVAVFGFRLAAVFLDWTTPSLNRRAQKTLE